jgi:tetratricopeptide (TPR) repeat protein
MVAGLEADKALKDWKNAAKQAGTLSELALAAGALLEAIRTAEQSVELADRSDDAFQRMSKRTALADALHQAGRTDEAAARFHEAEEMQRAQQPKYPLLYSARGYRYCDLLLAQGQVEEVLRRAGQTLKWAEQAAGAGLLDIALDHLSLGRAHFMLANLTPDSDVIASAGVPSESLGLPRRSAARNDETLARAAAELDRAVAGLGQAGQQDEMPRGLLARAALRRATRDFERGRRDLDETLVIAARGACGCTRQIATWSTPSCSWRWGTQSRRCSTSQSPNGWLQRWATAGGMARSRSWRRRWAQDRIAS